MRLHYSLLLWQDLHRKNWQQYLYSMQKTSGCQKQIATLALSSNLQDYAHTILFGYTRIISNYFQSAILESLEKFKHSDQVINRNTKYALPLPWRSFFRRDHGRPITTSKQFTPVKQTPYGNHPKTSWTENNATTDCFCFSWLSKLLYNKTDHRKCCVDVRRKIKCRCCKYRPRHLFVDVNTWFEYVWRLKTVRYI